MNRSPKAFQSWEWFLSQSLGKSTEHAQDMANHLKTLLSFYWPIKICVCEVRMAVTSQTTTLNRPGHTPKEAKCLPKTVGEEGTGDTGGGK